METSKSSKKVLTIVSFLLFSSLILTGWVVSVNSGLKSQLNNERLKQDSVLSTKILLDKEILSLTNEISSQKGHNSRLDSLLNSTTRELESKKKTIAFLTKENGSVKSLRKELQQIKKLKENLHLKLEELATENKKLYSENNGLKSKIQSLEDQVEELNKNRKEESYAAQNFRIELQKKNANKLTAKVKRTKNIQLHIDLVGKSEGSEQTIYVKIVDPLGYVISPYITPVVILGEQITYTKSHKVKLEGSSKRAIIDIKPDKKMKSKGVYKILVYSEGEGLIGSAEIKTN